MEIPTASSLVKVNTNIDDKIKTIIDEIKDNPNKHLYTFTFDGAITDDLVKMFEEKEFEVSYTISYKKGKKLTEIAISNPKIQPSLNDFSEMFNGENFKKKMEFSMGGEMNNLGDMLKGFINLS